MMYIPSLLLSNHITDAFVNIVTSMLSVVARLEYLDFYVSSSLNKIMLYIKNVIVGDALMKIILKIIFILYLLYIIVYI